MFPLVLKHLDMCVCYLPSPKDKPFNIMIKVAGVKITRGPWARGPFLREKGPYMQAPRNSRGQNIENEKIFDFYKPWPIDSDEGS